MLLVVLVFSKRARISSLDFSHFDNTFIIELIDLKKKDGERESGSLNEIKDNIDSKEKRRKHD